MSRIVFRRAHGQSPRALQAAAPSRRLGSAFCLLLLVPALSACGSSQRSAESVLRAWSQELNSGDNEAAAKLFAEGARVVQPGLVLRLETHKQAVAWNSALPCSGKIVSMKSNGDVARATFVLGDRQTSKCDGPGQKATALIRVRKGKIVLWHQTGGTAEEPAGPSV